MREGGREGWRARAGERERERARERERERPHPYTSTQAEPGLLPLESPRSTVPKSIIVLFLRILKYTR